MKRLFLVVCMLLVCASLTGCAFWMNGEYLSVTPHVEQNIYDSDDVVKIENYTDVEEALSGLVEHANQRITLSMSFVDENIAKMYIENAAKYIQSEHPIGAYAVEKVNYEIGVNRDVSVIACNLVYRYDRGQILRMRKADNMHEVSNVVYEALANCDPSMTVLVEDYTAEDIPQIVQTYAERNPNIVIETPAVNVSVYPDQGKRRVVDIFFTYQTNRDSLRNMQENVANVFTSAELYVKESEEVLDIYTMLFSFLMERNEYTLETSITPAYSLLHHGVGDSRAFANVYAAMCRQSGLDCRVVSGTKNGSPWFWTLVRYRGQYHHVDVIESDRIGQIQLLPDNEMPGYVWDYSAYPTTE